MVRLITHLPNELLREILLFASTYDRVCPLRDLALVNKQIRQVAFPLLVRHWERERSFQQPHLGLLALHLLRHPEHRTQVKTLNFMSPSTRDCDEAGSILYDQSPVRLQPESLVELARAAGKAIPNLAQSSNWTGRIRMGCFHALAVLVLAWTTRVTDVAMELPRPNVCFQINDSYVMMLKFFHEAAQQVYTRGQNEAREMLLAEVQRLHIETWEAGLYRFGSAKFPLSVFRLPKLKRLYIEHLELENSQEVTIPRGCSTVEELFLGRSKVKGASLRKILAACPKLRVLHYAWFDIILEFPDKRIIRDALIEEAGSLEELHLDLMTYTYLHPTSRLHFGATGNGTVVEQSFKTLSHLRKFTLDLEDLSKRFEDPREIMPDFLTTQLPASLEELTLTWCNPWKKCLEEDFMSLDGIDIWLGVVVAIRTLLEEAGPGCKFDKLRLLDVTEILVGSQQMEEFVELGRSKGINVLENTG
ncbi:hypothetical protein NW768_004669 [Fusarium equiseti]|uniref:F-box domain-containing protein n=1 Tax=Fusarium equiseti TaxID=61235 RepID=A0ABQ8RGT5_FUSEQ|nr:hypothetical protein NW768_004669 [Fusarium equiseti]